MVVVVVFVVELLDSAVGQVKFTTLTTPDEVKVTKPGFDIVDPSLVVRHSGVNLRNVGCDAACIITHNSTLDPDHTFFGHQWIRSISLWKEGDDIYFLKEDLSQKHPTCLNTF